MDEKTFYRRLYYGLTLFFMLMTYIFYINIDEESSYTMVVLTCSLGISSLWCFITALIQRYGERIIRFINEN